jgi:hypothetical protein
MGRTDRLVPDEPVEVQDFLENYQPFLRNSENMPQINEDFSKDVIM